MIVMESRHGRRFVVRIERGEDVVGTLKKLAMSERVRAAWVRGTGLCEWVELTDWDPSREALRAPRHLEGPLALLACEGNISLRLGEPYVELRAALSREGDVGLTLVGGQLVIASSLNVELVVDVFEDVRLDRDEERETGLSVWKGERTPGAVARPTERKPNEKARPQAGAQREASPARETSPAREASPARDASPARETAPARIVLPSARTHDTDDADGTPTSDAPAALGWAEVARASSAAESKATSVERRTSSPSSTIATVPIFDKPKDVASSDDEPHPKKGDYVDHRQFGLCRVDGENVDGGLMIRLASGMRKVVHTDALEVMPPRYEGDRRIFGLRPRKR